MAAEAALRACGYEPQRIQTGGGSDANALQAAGFPCLTWPTAPSATTSRPSASRSPALEGMLDVALALLEEAAAA